MKRLFKKIMPIVAAVLFATSCGKDDDNGAAVDQAQNQEPVQEEVVDNTVKTITITGKIGKECLSKVTVAENALTLEVDDEFTFGTEGEGNIYGSIKITDAETRAYTATVNFPTGKESDLLAGGFTAIKGSKPTAMSAKYGNLAKAVADAYYEIPFKVTKDDDKYLLETTAPGQSGDILVFVQNAFINAQRTGTISLGGESKKIEIGNYYIVPVGVSMGKGTPTAAGKIYTVKKLAGTISFAEATITKTSIDDVFTNALTISGKGSVTYSTGNEKVATVDANGKVTIQGVGNTTITATVTGNDEYNYATTEVSYVLTVNGLKNEFTVGANTKVEFALGNLQYKTSTKTYQIAEHQWDYIGNSGANKGSSGIRDLFGWGSWVGKANPMKNSNTSVYEYSWSGNEPISGWRTLTGGPSGEWNYLFNTRANALSKYAWGKVNGVFGIIILPDEWPTNKNPAGCTFAARSSTCNYTVGEDGTWNQMEANGAVFIPAAGERNSTEIYDVGSSAYGHYWSSTSNSTSYAYDLYFGHGILYSSDDYSIVYYGQSVRLVHDL